MKTNHLFVRGDSRVLDQIGDSSIHLVVTSPPYWQLKDYGSDGQIGFNDSYEDYINNLNLVWKECFRVLHPGCKLAINIGDQFARSVYYGRYKVIPIRTEIIKFCETIGMDYMGAIIWQKKTTMNTTGGASVMGSYPYPRNGIVEIDYEFVLLFKKMGTPPKVTKEIKEKSALSKEEWKEYFSGHWYFSGERQDKHLAMFPVELPSRLIKMFTFYGETVLDPFLGSGTTTLAAIQTERNSIGYEVNADFLKVIKDRINSNKTIFDNINISFSAQSLTNQSFNEEILKLPYQFKDPIKLSKEIDPRKMNFGSKITNGDIKKINNESNFLRIKEIMDVDLLKAENDLTIRLIGIKKDINQQLEAIKFLEKKLKNQMVFLRFDKEKYDNDKNLFAYVYMKNKTFINLHLIKKGFANTDREKSFNLKEKFINIEEARNG
jgi:site-specific DNA-methyltransferase (adenine-specific)